MPRKMTDDEQRNFIGALEFLEMMWGVKTHYDIDVDRGRGDVRIWLPGTETVLFLGDFDVRRLRVVEREKQRFRDAPDHGNPEPTTDETR